MDLGSITIKNEKALISARKKIYALCNDFNLSSFHTIRIATLASDMLRSIIGIGGSCKIKVSFEKQADNYGLRFHFYASEIQVNLSDLEPFFDSMYKKNTQEGQDFEIFISIPHLNKNVDDNFLQHEKEKIEIKSQEELVCVQKNFA